MGARPALVVFKKNLYYPVPIQKVTTQILQFLWYFDTMVTVATKISNYQLLLLLHTSITERLVLRNACLGAVY